MNIKKKKTSKWISKEGTSPLFIWEESFSISHSSIMNSENHWRAKKMDVLANYRPGAERKFPDHYRILVASKCWTAQRRLCCAVLFVDSWSCENTDLGSLIGKWEYTMWKFQDFSATQILREINFGHFEAPKTAILTIWAPLDFKFLGTSDIFKCEISQKFKIQSLKMFKTAVFDHFTSAKIDFT